MKELAKAIIERRAVLFVGAGASMQFGLPNFRTFIEGLAKELDFDEDLFLMAADYLGLAEYYRLQTGSLTELIKRIRNEWSRPQALVGASPVHSAIVKLRFPTIFTTNFDHFIEQAHEYHGVRYHRIVNIRDLAEAPDERTQIVKLHGDVDDEASIVLTESQYFDRLDFESPLDVKLRADVTGRSVLFIGYSLTDINVRYLFYKLSRLWESVDNRGARPHSYIFLPTPNIVQESILNNRSITPIVSQFDDAGKGLSSFLDELLQTVSAMSSITER